MTLFIVLDTNILLLASEGKFNLTIEIERLVPQKHEIVFLSTCLKELDYLIEKPKMVRKVQFARKLLETIRVIDYESNENLTFDDKILQFAIDKGHCVVATNDIELKNRLIVHKIPVLFIRSKKHLELIGTIQNQL